MGLGGEVERLEGSDRGETRDVVDGNHVDRVVDVRYVPDLDTSLDQSPDKVVRVRHYTSSNQ